MTRIRSIFTPLLALVAVAGLLASCGSSASGAPLTVNGVSHSRADFTAELDILGDHPDFAEAMFRVRPSSDTVGSTDSAFAAEVLSLRVLIMLIEAEFDERGLSLDDEHLAAADETFTEDLVVLLDAMPADYQASFREWNAKLLVLRDEFAAEVADRPEEVTDDDVRAFFDDFPALFAAEEVCARHILVADEDLANTVLAELEGGADFADMAAEHTTDPSGTATGGDLGCTGPGRYVPEFEAAVWDGPVGEVQGPVQTEFGYHLILVESRGAQSFESVEADIRSFLESPASRDGQQLLGLWVQQALFDAEIEVDSDFGEWDSELGTVTAPTSSTTSTTSAG